MKRDSKLSSILLVSFTIIVFMIILSCSVFANEVKIKTIPTHRIALQVLASGEMYNVLESFPFKETGDGQVTYNIQTSTNKVDLKITVSYMGQTKVMERVKDIDNTKPINLVFLPGDIRVVEDTPKPVVNTTTETNTSVVNESVVKNVDNTQETTAISDIENNKTAGFLTGLNIVNVYEPLKKIASNKMFYYVIIGILAIGILAFIMKMVVIKKKPGEIRVTPLSSLTGGSSSDYTIKDSQLLEAERKIKLAQEELESIKQRRRKVSEAQQRYEQAKKELEDARKDEF